MKISLPFLLFFSLSINLFSQNIDKPNMSLRELKQNFDITQLHMRLYSHARQTVDLDFENKNNVICT